jgi:hypothetical protein
VKSALSTPTAVYLGAVSYGTYLWHWPVIILVTQRFHPNGPALFALTCLAATGIASLSYQLLERRVRQSRFLDAYRRPVIAAGLAISIVSGLLIAPTILRHHGTPNATAAARADSGNAGGWRIPVPADLDLAAAKNGRYGMKNCFRQPVDQCIAVKGSGQRMLLVGDSHASVLIPAIAGVASRHNLSLAVAILPNCPWQHGLVSAPPNYPANLPSSCRAHQDDWYDRVVPQYDPDIVVLVHRSDDDPLNHEDVLAPDGQRVTYGTEAYGRALRTSADDSVRLLRKPGRKIVIVKPVPLAPQTFDPLACLSDAKFLEGCRYVASARSTPVEQHYRSLADGTSLWLLDIDRLICPYFPICDPVVDGTIVKKDPQHITAAYSRQISVFMDAVLLHNGIIR